MLTGGGQLYGEPYNEQGSGGLVSSYTGTILLDETPGGIQFVGGSVIDANISGNWAPAPGSGTGSANADYGAFTNDVFSGQAVTIRLATRGLVADLTSGVIPLSGTDFTASGVSFAVTQGGTDWTVIHNASQTVQQLGHSTLVGSAATNVGAAGTFSAGLIKSLTFPIDVSIPIDGDNNGSFESIFALTGQLVAKENGKIYGDFDLDGDVDGADFVAWQTEFPTSSIGLHTADADGDGDVDGADFVVWQTNFPYTPSPGSSPVPEPGSIWLLLASAVGVVTIRRLQTSRTAARGL
jgi:hypothetical protein